MRTVAQKQHQPQQKSSINLTKSNRSKAASHEVDHPLLRLQRTIGNQAVLRLLRGRVDGEIRSTADKGRVIDQPQAPVTIQTPADQPSSVQNVLSSSGQPLDASSRTFFEPRFGHDFSDVRVHSGAVAQQSARELNALAYTAGHNIVLGTNQLTAATQEGRRVLAHELTHVVQQTRAVNAPSPVIARWWLPMFSPVRFPGVSDADIKWIATLTKPPNILEQIDLGFSSTAELKKTGKIESDAKREVAKIEKTMKPGPDRDAEISKVRAAAATQSAAESQRFQAGREDHRKEFLYNMRSLLGPDPATENHFKAFEEVEGSPGLFLHQDAAARMKAVRAELKTKGQDLPRTTVGQSLRGRHIGDLPGKGMLGHALGFSIDYQAYVNPKISMEQGPERVALTRLFSGDPTRIKLSQPDRRAFLEQLGKRTAAGEDVEKDAKVKAFLTEFEQQFRLMQTASEQFKQSLPAENLADLKKLKDRYEKALIDLKPVDSSLKTLDKKITDARKAARKLIARQEKIKAADVAAEDIDAHEKVSELLEQREPLAEQKESLEAEKEAVRAELQTVFQPWLTKIQEKIDPLREVENKEGIAVDQIPSEAELKKAVNELKNIQRQEKRLLGESNAKRAERLNDSISKLRAKIAPVLEKFDSAIGPHATPPDGQPLSATERLEQVDKFKEAQLRRREINVWTSLAKNLTENTRFVFGDLEDSKPRLKLESKDPSVSQLLGLLDIPGRKTDEGGFFKPDPDTEKNGFNFLFFKTMVKHGFEPGATWGHGSTDPMHFDFVEGWNKMK